LYHNIRFRARSFYAQSARRRGSFLPAPSRSLRKIKGERYTPYGERQPDPKNYSFTAPTMRPFRRCFCETKNSATAGAAARIVPAATTPQLVSKRCWVNW